MSTSSTKLSWLVVSLIALLVLYFFMNFERATREITVGFRGEAETNRYLVAQRLLESMGVRTHPVHGIQELDEEPLSEATILLPTRRRTLSRERSERLLDWVRRGGHLIVLAWIDSENPEKRTDHLLDPLHFEQYVAEVGSRNLSIDPNAPPGNEHEGESYLDYTAIARIHFRDRDDPLLAEFYPQYSLVRTQGPVRWSISDRNGAHVMQIDLGTGLLTVMTDDSIFANNSIGDHDHAELFWRLLHGSGRDGPIWIVSSEDFPGAWSLLVSKAWMVLSSLIILVCAWIWSVSLRSGPRQPDEQEQRRRLMEHVEASGRFQWRLGEGTVLTAAVRAAVMDRVRQRHPGWVALSPAEISQRLAELVDLPAESVARALIFQRKTDRERFPQDIATLEKIRRAL